MSINPIHIRLLSQQLAAPQFTRPEEVVAHFGAMQAQEYRMMRWAVEMRCKRPSEKAFVKAYNTGKIIRLHLLRGTWQLVAAEDYAWMLDLCGAKARQVIRGWMHASKIEIDEDELHQIREILIAVTEVKGSVTKEDYHEALAARGITMDDHRLSYHIRFAELDGVLCSGDLLPMKATYALTAMKIPVIEKKDREESLALLTRKYFQSHQPATLEDLVWWSGLGINDCRRGIELLKTSLPSSARVELAKQPHNLITLQPQNLLMFEGYRTRGVKKDSYLLIPPYDEYLIGYKSRDVVLDPEHCHHAHNNSGIFQPVIARGGEICGNWSPFATKLEAKFFKEGHREEDLANAWEEYVRYSQSRFKK